MLSILALIVAVFIAFRLQYIYQELKKNNALLEQLIQERRLQ